MGAGGTLEQESKGKGPGRGSEGSLGLGLGPGLGVWESWEASFNVNADFGCCRLQQHDPLTPKLNPNPKH